MKRILIVDDEFLIRYSFSHMLEGKSAHVITAMTGNDALREMEIAPFDLCCLDIHLPDISGMELMKRIKLLAPRTKIIMMTGGEVTDEMLGEIRRHAELLLSKPFDLYKVKSFVGQILGPDSPAPAAGTGGAGNCSALEYSLMNDQRKHERRPSAERVACTEVFPHREQERRAEIVDVSEKGLCLMTTYLLPRGVMLRICNDKTERCTGTVRWCMRVGDKDLFRAGVEFSACDGLAEN